ncbi:hypothetical protein FQN54_009733 [Arachnomyces sp. PD_36]|nr:hypothetical protein FQN54_009733 [Arachnomyces sp. PD_36]
MENHTLMSRTVFFISNLHCPSCITNIERALNALNPKPYSISHSIVSHTVTVNHSPSQSVKTLSNALKDEGYEIYSAVSNPHSNDPVSFRESSGSELETGDIAESDLENGTLGWNNSHHSADNETWTQALQRWAYPGSVAQEQTRKRKRHMENCEQCRAQAKLADGEVELEKPDDKNLFAVVPTSASMKRFSATIAITGMSCSSCVQQVSEGIGNGNPWIESVDVNLLTHSAKVVFTGEDRGEEVVKIIEDMGYDASIQQIEEVDVCGPIMKPDTWKASYSITGMTCSSCVGGVTNALQNLSWTRSVDVNLIANSATVVFEGKDHLGDILETIEDLGYDAKMNDVIDLSRDALKETRRTVSIRVEGMYCQHCPERAVSAVQSLSEQVTIEKHLTLKDPVMRVSYLPDVPHLTIRNILAAISAADDAFTPSVYHPLTIEQRSQMMQAREQRNILFRVILSVMVAIPTFIIGIAYMNLVSSSDSNRQYLMEHLSGVSRANWALFIMATPVYFFAGDIFHRRTLKELRALWRPGSPTPIARRFYRFGTMNMLVSLGTTIAYFASIAELIVAATLKPSVMEQETPSYFDSVVFLTMFLLIGRWIEAYSKAKTGDAVAMLGKLRPTEAILVSKDATNSNDGSESSNSKVNVDLLEFGDVIRVLHGGSPACDGTIIEGDSKFDESSLTGEAKLVTKSVGDEVYSGTMNQGGAVSIRVSGVAGASMLDKIMEVVREGQTRRAPVERVADAITGYFVPFVTLIAIVTWLVWLALGLTGSLPSDYRDTEVGGWPFWSLQFAIAVFVIACPCGIGLAAPTALFVGGGLAANHGILVKGGGEAFQEASRLDCIVFDKTGTLTQGGEPVITDHQLLQQSGAVILAEGMVLSAVKKLEEDSSHPIAKAIVDFCEDRGTSNVEGKETREVAGKGMKGSFTTEELPGQTIEVLVGNESLMADYDINISATERTTLESWKKESKSVALAAVRIVPDADGGEPTAWTIYAIFAISDPLRPEAPGVVRALQDRGIDVWMISGDNPLTAFAVGNKIGISQENIIAGVLPEQKADKIKDLQRSLKKRRTRSGFFGKKGQGEESTSTTERAIIAMVGDGINDSPALTTADVGIAIGSGSDVAISTAKFVLITSQLTSLLTLIDLSRVVFRRIKFNFGWALVYNLIALPVAAGVLYPVKSGGGTHVRLDPVWAALAMALSSTSVVCSSLLLRSGLPVVGFRARKGVDV